jgi:hypothetical protein
MAISKEKGLDRSQELRLGVEAFRTEKGHELRLDSMEFSYLRLKFCSTSIPSSHNGWINTSDVK